LLFVTKIRIRQKKKLNSTGEMYYKNI